MKLKSALSLMLALALSAPGANADAKKLNFKDSKGDQIAFDFELDGAGGVQFQREGEPSWIELAVSNESGKENIFELIQIRNRLFYVFTRSQNGNVTPYLGEIMISGSPQSNGGDPILLFLSTLFTSVGLAGNLGSIDAWNQAQTLLQHLGAGLGFVSASAGVLIGVTGVAYFFSSALGSIYNPPASSAKLAKPTYWHTIHAGEKDHTLQVTNIVRDESGKAIDAEVSFRPGRFSWTKQVRLSKLINAVDCVEALNKRGTI